MPLPKKAHETQRIDPWLADASECAAWKRRAAKEDAILRNFERRICAEEPPTSVPRPRGTTTNKQIQPPNPPSKSAPDPTHYTPETSHNFHSSPYHTAARQVHKWQDYHQQRNPLTSYSNDPAHPNYIELIRSDASFNSDTHTRTLPQQAAGDLDAVPTKPAGALLPSGQREVVLYQTHLRPSDKVHPRHFEPDKLVIPGVTKHNKAIAHQMVKDPPGLHNNACTTSERNFLRDPQAGMLWSQDKGWYVSPQHPKVDARHL